MYWVIRRARPDRWGPFVTLKAAEERVEELVLSYHAEEFIIAKQLKVAIPSTVVRYE